MKILFTLSIWLQELLSGLHSAPVVRLDHLECLFHKYKLVTQLFYLTLLTRNIIHKEQKK